METKAVDPGYSLPENKPRTAKKTLDKNDFLYLLVNQMKNQDPMDPQSNEEFVSTMAQFSSLETLSSLDRNSQYSQAMSMMGKPVTVQKMDKEPVTGRVEKAGIVEGKVVVYVGGEEYGLSEVRELLLNDPASGNSTGSDLIQAALMIGQLVRISAEDGELTGIVEKVGLDKGFMKVFVDGTPYNVTDIIEIGWSGEESEEARAGGPAGGGSDAGQEQDATEVVASENSAGETG